MPSPYPQQSDADGLIPRLQQENVNFTYHVGTMIELPRAALQAVWALHASQLPGKFGSETFTPVDIKKGRNHGEHGL